MFAPVVATNFPAAFCDAVARAERSAATSLRLAAAYVAA